MIVTQAIRKAQMLRRLRAKDAEARFTQQIVQGTNCSPFESEIIVDKAKEVFGVGQYAEERVLLDGQMIFHAVAAEARPGCSIEECDKVRIVVTPIDRREDLEVFQDHGAAAKRRQQLMRMALEAREQGCLLTQEDLALVLGCDVRTIRSDIQRLRDAKIIVPTRGTVRDIGPGVTHKRRAIELWLSGREPLEVARSLHHSLHAVERYIQTFCRVVYAQRRLRNILKTALVVGISVPAANTYFDLHCDLIDRDQTYPGRLEEILRVGESHWEASDAKKNLSSSERGKGGGARR